MTQLNPGVVPPSAEHLVYRSRQPAFQNAESSDNFLTVRQGNPFAALITHNKVSYRLARRRPCQDSLQLRPRLRLSIIS
jgi:hypothetical protein